MPSEPPTCCIVLTSALAAPASWFGTPSSAVDDSGTNTWPMPRLISSIDGTTCVRYAESAGSWVSHSMPSDGKREAGRGQHPRAEPRQRRDAIVADVITPSGNGRNATPALSAL